VFEEVVRLCAQAGLVPGDEAAADGSQVEACASRHKRLPGRSTPETGEDREAQARPVREYLEALAATAPSQPDEPQHDAPKHLSPSDPVAAWSNKHGTGVFAYETNLLVDTAHGVIVDVGATPARLSQEIVAAKVMLKRAEETFGFDPGCLGADKSYGTGPFLTWLLTRGTAPHIPVLDRTAQTDGMFTRESFTYKEADDVWRCPADHDLVYRGLERKTGMRRYGTRPADCQRCRLKSQCTSGEARTLSVSIHEPARQEAKALAETEAFRVSRRRRLKVEMLFAHLKQQLGIRQSRLRGLQGAAEEFNLAAAVQNLRRLANLTACAAVHGAETVAIR
jgi:hypothetical protein